MSLEHIKLRMEAALRHERLARKQYIDALYDLNARMQPIMDKLNAKLTVARHGISVARYSTDTFMIDGEPDIVGVRVTLVRDGAKDKDAIDGEFPETALLTIRDIDSIFKEEGLQNYSTENFDKAYATYIVYV